MGKDVGAKLKENFEIYMGKDILKIESKEFRKCLAKTLAEWKPSHF